MTRTTRAFGFAAAGFLLLSAIGCKSYWIDADVENRTGKTVHELEVDYPTASFGANAIAADGAMHYRLQIRGGGPVKVEYTFEDGKTVHAEGPNLEEHQQGRIVIELLPAGKVDFVPSLQPAS